MATHEYLEYLLSRARELNPSYQDVTDEDVTGCLMLLGLISLRSMSGKKVAQIVEGDPAGVGDVLAKLDDGTYIVCVSDLTGEFDNEQDARRKWDEARRETPR